MRAHLRRFAFWFAMEFVVFALVVANGRAYNQGLYFATFITDMMISANGWYIGKKFINETDKDSLDFWGMAGCTLGGGLGSVCTIFITKKIYGA